jgi:hypothetical protein
MSVQSEARMLEIKRSLGLETKANEVEHSTNAGFGAELVPDVQYSKEILDMIPQYSSLLAGLPGNHGNNLPASLEVAAIGELGFFENASEWTTGAPSLGVQGRAKAPTDKVILTPRKMDFTIDLSDELLEMAVTDVDAWVRGLIARAAARTCESIIINADPTTGTANINSKGVSVASNDSRHWMKPEAGLIKTAMTQTATYDMGAMDGTDFFAVANILGDMYANPDDCIWIMNRSTLNKASTIDTFLEGYKSGKESTLLTGAVGNFLGSDVFVSRNFVKTDATGSIDLATPANNVKGGVILLNKMAVQYGFGKELTIEAVRVPGRGYQLVGVMRFAHAIASKLAGQVDPTVALGINATTF